MVFQEASPRDLYCDESVMNLRKAQAKSMPPLPKQFRCHLGGMKVAAMFSAGTAQHKACQVWVGMIFALATLYIIYV
jgi:hypothetical protein